MSSEGSNSVKTRRSDKRPRFGAPSEVAAEYQRLGSQLLQRLAKADMHAERRDDQIVIVNSGTGASTASGMPTGVLSHLIEAGAVRCVSHGGRAKFVITPEGQARLRREVDGEVDFGAQHRLIETRTITAKGRSDVVRVNLRDDPLEMLRRGRHMPHMLGPAEFEAGMRLQREFMLAQSAPQVTANWSRLVVDGAGYRPGMSLSETVVEARGRVAAAMQAVGPDFAGVLTDVCAFSKGIETIEQEHALPTRSGKVVLGLALRALARHYGLANVATGKAAGGIRHWGAEGYRPAMTHR